ncbi:prolyl endopeptidase [Actinorhabdospora filicis]|uniref:prolyl oligopeptidase n=1 Tax=Actinorhabdospora filicis TaxID=1785913 RepID=A0A9W6W749_9ACTN|nr:prolyl oligopeptidase family serine peptidase [Actinorhabdospora filicis]GLZ76189.1 prolyl endopeptidase [Actinorhabdospora filicis]
MTHPVITRSEAVVERHGVRVLDPFRILEDPAHPETAAWQEAQDALAAARFAELDTAGPLRLLASLERPAIGLPRAGGDRRFHTLRGPEDEQPVLIVTVGGEERVLLDPLELAADGTVGLDGHSPSPDGRLIAVHTSRMGDDRCALRVLDVDSGAEVDAPDPVGWVGDVAWLPDASAFVYSRDGELWRHAPGTPWADDVRVLAGQGVPGAEYRLSIAGTRLAVTLVHGSNIRSDVFVLDLATGGRTDVHIGRDVLSTAFFDADGRLLLLTTDGAPNGRVVEAGEEEWRDLIPESGDVLYDVAVLDGGVLAAHRHHVVSRLTLYPVDGPPVPVALPGPGTARLGGNGLVSFTDPVTPPHLLRLDGTRLVPGPGPAPVPVPGVEVRQEFAVSADGTRVPMFVLSPAGAEGPLPTVVEGYGGWGVSWPPEYRAHRLAWVLSGGRYAWTNLRGGGEYGAEWFLGGMRREQQNPIDDFVACARHLTDLGLTSPELLAATGGSKGGLTVGAAITQAPDLYAAAVMNMPMLDMVRYEEYGVGGQWVDGFGTAEDPADFAALVAISPLNRIRPGVRYPSALLTVLDHDTRVDPAHARKLTAALQDAGSKAVLRRKAESGHGGSSAGRARDLHADHIAFLAGELGLKGNVAGA